MTPSPAVLTIGKFDGVHVGHRALALRAREAADALDLDCVALILYPHPATVLAGARIPILQTPRERAHALRQIGVDHVEVVTFDRALAAMGPRRFVDMLRDRFGLRSIVVGPDFRFGRGRAGDVDMLTALGNEMGFEVIIVQPIEADGEKVSSGRIRSALQEGDIRSAARWLGRAPRITGRVVHGAQRGRTIGFPTANLELRADYAVPADGVYAVRCSWTRGDDGGSEGGSESGNVRDDDDAADRSAMGAASIGIRPTFDAGERSIEVFLIDFSGDLYGVEMTVEFVEFLRPEARFDDVEALIEAMHDDVRRARKVLGAEGPARSAGPTGSAGPVRSAGATGA